MHIRKEDRGDPQCAGVRWSEAESRRREQRREEEEAEQRLRQMKRLRRRKPRQTTPVHMDDRAHGLHRRMDGLVKEGGSSRG